MKRNYSQSEGLRHVDCNTPFAKAVCLICNIHKSYGNLSWYYENSGTQLARDNLNLYSKHAGGMIVNGCKSQNYSLKLMHPSANHTLYYCKTNDLTLLSFHVTVQGMN
ncbi:hypothetical protein HOLleu_22662 [Holothuria leucospilota]|uniref:Uncharacterized protein n=1 Tax=Holothuria leucospilota TaxID=206669 RepID=A0A9Q1BZR3_HOLLE|nr:hypothetical protein HOLleu_22662 [Holothuria leucospilota]